MNRRYIAIVGADPFPPYQYLDEDGDAAGIDFETVRAAFARAGYAMELLLRGWPEIERMMNAGELDAAFQVQKTPEREKRWLFSDLLRNAVTEVVSSRPDLHLQCLAQAPAKGWRVGLIKGYAYGEAADLLPAAARQEYPSQEALLRAVSRAEVPFAVFDRGVREHLCAALSINNIHSVPGLDFIRPLHVIFKEQSWREAFNKGLAERQAEFCVKREA